MDLARYARFWTEQPKHTFASDHPAATEPRPFVNPCVRLDELRPGWPGWRRPPANLPPIVIDEVTC